MKIGYWATVGEYRRGKVHIVSDGKPICGCKVGAKAEYQMVSEGVYLQYVECERCKRHAKTFGA